MPLGQLPCARSATLPARTLVVAPLKIISAWSTSATVQQGRRPALSTTTPSDSRSTIVAGPEVGRKLRAVVTESAPVAAQGRPTILLIRRPTKTIPHPLTRRERRKISARRTELTEIRSAPAHHRRRTHRPTTTAPKSRPKGKVSLLVPRRTKASVLTAATLPSITLLPRRPAEIVLTALSKAARPRHRLSTLVIPRRPQPIGPSQPSLGIGSAGALPRSGAVFHLCLPPFHQALTRLIQVRVPLRRTVLGPEVQPADQQRRRAGHTKNH